ncbi:MAG: RNA methyltransferase [Solirubrobacterales bacterium]|nr:RNA methyltransferase [Solirubrobacterales bacterium]
MITSPDNTKLKQIRKLRNRRDREKLGRFVAEGEDLLAAASNSGWSPVESLVAGVDLSSELLESVSELASGTRALGVFETRWASVRGPLCVYLHGVGDPGNVGTILRSAEAFGASCVALGPGCADPFGPKSVRASMGAIFTVPVARAGVESLPGVKIALDAGGSMFLRVGITTSRDISVVLGSEREGLPREVIEKCDHVARIPIKNHSLNVAMAATVALYELSSRAHD